MSAMLCPVTRYAVAGGVWLHLGQRRRGKPVYRFRAEASKRMKETNDGQ